MKSTTTKGKDKTPTKTSPTAVSPVEEVDQPPLYTKADTSITDHIGMWLDMLHLIGGILALLTYYSISSEGPGSQEPATDRWSYVSN